jgi:hypothetical protein
VNKIRVLVDGLGERECHIFVYQAVFKFLSLSQSKDGNGANVLNAMRRAPRPVCGCVGVGGCVGGVGWGGGSIVTEGNIRTNSTQQGDMHTSVVSTSTLLQILNSKQAMLSPDLNLLSPLLALKVRIQMQNHFASTLQVGAFFSSKRCVPAFLETSKTFLNVRDRLRVLGFVNQKGEIAVQTTIKTFLEYQRVAK